jgi:hypothetical protein
VPRGDAEVAEAVQGFADGEGGFAAGDERDAGGIVVSSQRPEVLLQLAEIVGARGGGGVAEFGVAVVSAGRAVPRIR